MGRKFGNEACVVTVVCAAYGDIGFSAAPYYIEVVDLYEAFVAFGRETEHDFSESDYLAHFIFVRFIDSISFTAST